jgi:hypothetical protein
LRTLKPQDIDNKALNKLLRVQPVVLLCSGFACPPLADNTLWLVLAGVKGIQLGSQKDEPVFLIKNSDFD